MQNLYTNRSSKKDFVQNGIYENVKEGMDIFIASAFFTEFDVIKMLLEKNCHIRIIVRLGFPTSPSALEKLANNNSIEARFYTNHSFHPKMYIFGDKSVMIGSANLTRSAILTNQEVMVGLPSNDSRFDELTQLFAEYWDEAEVLNEDAISSYRSIYEKFKKASQLVDELDSTVIDELGDKTFSNINRGKKKTTKKSIFLDTYRKSYQESVSAFRKIEEVYSLKDRKVGEDDIPLRLEIDSFFSFVRDCHATQETWKQQPIGWNDSKKIILTSLIDEWLITEWIHFEERIVPENYPLIRSVFGSQESINSASAEEIVDALCVLHSFHDRLRFYKGGLETLKSEFLASNNITDIKASLTYLFYGKGEIVSRMSDCLFDDRYKLNEFGQANVQELIGWISKENLPVINGRTTKVLRYFGFDVRQL
ncbi:phospholipase D-like domain-containing protein [Halomonas sp. AOP12-C2-37]|uniref:phospholipase D-like domain-containing protein n=1 Tax=unclassified Halomonas TaxID=2609666 RepID=UPI004034F6F3